MQLCNGDSVVLQSKSSGFGPLTTLRAGKNAYGLEINLKGYWLYGQDRRRIETKVFDEDSFEWLCNAGDAGSYGYQTTVIKYHLAKESTTTRTEGPGKPVDTTSRDSDSAAVQSNLALAMLPVAAALLALA